MNAFAEYAMIAALLVGGLAALSFLILWDDRTRRLRLPVPRDSAMAAGRHRVQRQSGVARVADPGPDFEPATLTGAAAAG